MGIKKDRIVRGNRLNLRRLGQIAARPASFEGMEPSFWNDPYVSKHILHAHLDPDDDEASRKSETIDRSVEWISRVLKPSPESGSDGLRLLDLGCGPGLYAQRLSAMGHDVTGIDLSAPSIDYARRGARRSGLSITYRCEDYTSCDLGGSYDGILIVYGSFSELSPENQQSVLRRAQDALRPGGRLVFDVVTRRYAERLGETDGWYVSDSDGFWAPGRHLVLEQTMHYPEDQAHLQRYIVVHADGSVRRFSLWRSYFSWDKIRTMVKDAGFERVDLYADLLGSPVDPADEWIGIVAETSHSTNGGAQHNADS